MQYRTAVQAEIEAQTGNQRMAAKLCGDQDIVRILDEYHDFLREQTDYSAERSAFMGLFMVYSYALQVQEYSLEERQHIAKWLNAADANAKADFRLYTTYAYLFLSAQKVMHQFCLENNLDPNDPTRKLSA